MIHIDEEADAEELDAGGLVDVALLADRQVHRQVQEGVLAAVLDAVGGGQRGRLVGQQRVVLGVLGNPLRSRELQADERFVGPHLGPGLAEKGADLVSAWIKKHRCSCLCIRRGLP